MASLVGLLLIGSAHAAPPSNYGTLTLLNTPGPQAKLEFSIDRRPREPNIVTRCGTWFTERLIGKGVTYYVLDVDLPPTATHCDAWVLDEGTRNGKDPVFITPVINFEVVQ